MSFTPNSYLYIWGIVKGVALGVAAIVVSSLGAYPIQNAPQLAFWAGGVAAVMVSHVTTVRGTLLTSFRYNSFDAIIPLAMGTIECLLFVVLQPNQDQPSLWQSWYWLLSAHAALAIGLVSNRLALTKPEDFDEELRPLAAEYTLWLKADIRGATLLALMFAAFGLVSRKWVVPQGPSAVWWEWIAGVAAVVMFATVFLNADRQRNRIIEFLGNLPETKPAT